jgi:hypothetical protein
MSAVFYQGKHRTQFEPANWPTVNPRAKENCTPTSGANGARAATGGRVDLSGAQVRAKVYTYEETSPNTPGWSLTDLDKAMERLEVPFAIGHGGWEGVREARAAHKPVVLQGDSEEFPNGTCSGRFDGDHAVTIHPDDDSGPLWLLADPICKGRRWESEAVLRRYATNFRPSISYGVFLTPVPILAPPPVVVPTGWVRVTGAWWPYTVRGNPTIGYDATTRPLESKVTKGFSANVGKVIEAYWGGRDRVFAKLLTGIYAESWVDLLDDGSVRHFAA